MASYTLSQAADRDIADIYSYSFKHFGESKADAYLCASEECLMHLAVQPEMGRKIGYVREGYRRYEYVSHSIFYTVNARGIFVVRILHQSMHMEQRL